MDIRDAAELLNMEYADRRIEIDELLRFHDEALIVIHGLLGALTPKQQARQWPNLVSRARLLIDKAPR